MWSKLVTKALDTIAGVGKKPGATFSLGDKSHRQCRALPNEYAVSGRERFVFSRASAKLHQRGTMKQIFLA
jgi:hypothetical protein